MRSHTRPSALHTVPWLLAEVVRLLVQFILTVCLEVLGCAVRLLYWSVRTYGWGRVAGVLGVVFASVYLHAVFGRLSVTAASVGSVTLTSLALWAGFWLVGPWALRRGRHWLGSASHPSGIAVSFPETAATVSLPAGTSAPSPSALPAPPAIGALPATPAPTGGELWERVVNLATLQQAWRRVLVRNGSPGPDGLSVESFALDADRNLEILATAMRSGQYRPAAPRWIEVPKPNGRTRRLAILGVRDRIVEQAIHAVLAPVWNPRLAPCSYAYRPGRSAQQAVAAVEQALAQGRVWVVDADIEAFFDSVPLPGLFGLLQEWVTDDRVRQLVEWSVAAASPTQGRGLAQGAPLSPLLANLYLDRFDRALLQAGHVPVRYADDVVILCATRQQAELALGTATRLLAGLELRLNAEKTRLVHRDEGFTFLGYVFSKEGKRPGDRALASLNARLSAAADDQSRRQIVAGWQGYFGAATTEATEDGGGHRDAGATTDGTATTEHTEKRGEHRDEGSVAEWTEPWWEDMQPQSSQRSTEDTETRTMSPWARVSSGSVSSVVLFRARFLGRPEVFARYWQNAGRHGYAPVRHSPTDEDLQAHLAGEIVLGTYLLHPDGMANAMVWDVDGPNASDDGHALAFQCAHRLIAALQRQGLSPVWVDSGGKGYHLWLCFSAPAAAKTVRDWAGQWLDRFRPFPEGVLVEVFPKQDELGPAALGALIRLPFGRHPETGRPSRLLSLDGRALDDPWAVLAATCLVNPEALPMIDQAGQTPSPCPEPPESIAPVVWGCRLVWELVRKAAGTRDLRHAERRALLYAVGGLGEAGRTYVHQVIGLCSNYDPRITERWIQRLEPGHRPIRCATLREWLKDYLPGVTCNHRGHGETQRRTEGREGAPCPCVTRAANPSPIDLLRRSARAKPAAPPTGPQRTEEAWNDVAEEMFGEALLSVPGASAERGRGNE